MEISEMTQSVLEFGLSHIILELSLQNFFVDGHIIQVFREFIYLEKRRKVFCSINLSNLLLKKISRKRCTILNSLTSSVLTKCQKNVYWDPKIYQTLFDSWEVMEPCAHLIIYGCPPNSCHTNAYFLHQLIGGVL